MKLLFVNGDRGLVATLHGKFYFPDRKSNIKEEGLYDCNTTVEKDRYAFVNGILEKTYCPSEYTVTNEINKYLCEPNSSDIYTIKNI